MSNQNGKAPANRWVLFFAHDLQLFVKGFWLFASHHLDDLRFLAHITFKPQHSVYRRSLYLTYVTISRILSECAARCREKNLLLKGKNCQMNVAFPSSNLGVLYNFISSFSLTTLTRKYSDLMNKKQFFRIT